MCTYEVEDKSTNGVQSVLKLLQHFFPYAQKQLGFHKPVMISFESDEENSNKLLGRTGHYNPDDSSIGIYVDGRHPKDVLRSLSHELVHHAQNCNGDFESTEELGPGYAQDNEAMRNAELDAYKRGNIIFRDFEDLIKKGDIAIEIDFESAGEPKMSLKEWKSDELNGLLMEKWGFKVQKEDHEDEEVNEAIEDPLEPAPEAKSDSGVSYFGDDAITTPDTHAGGEKARDAARARGRAAAGGDKGALEAEIAAQAARQRDSEKLGPGDTVARELAPSIALGKTHKTDPLQGSIPAGLSPGRELPARSANRDEDLYEGEEELNEEGGWFQQKLGGWKPGKQTGTMPKNPEGPENPAELEATTGTGTDVVSTVQDANRKQQSRADRYAAIADDTGGRKEDKKELEELTRWHELAGLDEQAPAPPPPHEGEDVAPSTTTPPVPTPPTAEPPPPPAAPAEEPAPASAIVARREDRKKGLTQENITLDEARDVARRIFEKLSESDELSEGWLDRLARGIQAGEGSEDRRSSTRDYAKGGGGIVVRGGSQGQRAKDYALLGLDPGQAPVDVEREMDQEAWDAVLAAADDASGGGKTVRGGSQTARAKAAERQGIDISTDPAAAGVQQQQQDKREKARRKRRPPIPPELDPGRPAGSIDVRMPGGGRRVREALVNKVLKKLIKEIK